MCMFTTFIASKVETKSNNYCKKLKKGYYFIVFSAIKIFILLRHKLSMNEFNLEF